MREMKDSGIEWVSRIPESWNTKKAKYNFTNTKYIPGIKSVEYDRLALTMKGVIHRSKDDADGLQPKDFLTYQLLRKGELVFKLIDLQNVTTSRVGLAHDTGLVSPAYIILKDTGEVLPEFAEKYFLMLWHREIFNALGDNGVRSSLNVTDLLNVPICYPSVAEQRSIVGFLNSKCAEIDALSADIQSEIDTLEAYKRSVITEAVTKGLDKNVTMKDSGMSWCPCVPAHWTKVSSKYLFSSSDLRRQNGDVQLTASQKYGIISQDEYMQRENAKIVLADQGLDKWKHVCPNDFIISLRSFQGGLEMSEVTGCITWHYVVLKATKPICYRYYKWLFKSFAYIKALQSTCNFIRDGQDLRYSNFSQVPLFIIPLKEQQEIADYLDILVADIDGIIKDKNEQLGVLADYKKSLIYEYVTGKKEVPAV